MTLYNDSIWNDIKSLNDALKLRYIIIIYNAILCVISLFQYSLDILNKTQTPFGHIL